MTDNQNVDSIKQFHADKMIVPTAEDVAKWDVNSSKMRAPRVSPDDARRIFANRKIDEAKIYKPKAVVASVQSFAAQSGQASNTVAAPASIAEMARALRNDVDLIFYHVYNQVDFYPQYGLTKGSMGALIDGIAGPFDQCQLLVDLLRQAGHTADFVLGDIDLSAEQVAAWLGTESSNIAHASWIFSNGGFPNNYYHNGTEWRITVSHCWVQVNIGGTNYVLDPSLKSYTSVSGINLATATGYDQSDLLADAQIGATLDTNGAWIEDANEANIKSNLTDYAMNLVDWIKTNNPTATLDEILGGRKINQIETPVRQTTLSYQTGTPSVVTAIPNSYRTTVRLQQSTLGFDITFYSDEIYHQRLTLFYPSLSNPLNPELRLDGVLLDTGNTVNYGATLNLSLTFDHPYPTTTFDSTVFVQTHAPYLPAVGGGAKYYLIGISLGATTKGMVDFHQGKAAAALAAGGAETYEPILGEQLAYLYHTYAAQGAKIGDLVGRMTNCTFVNHHMAFAIARDTNQQTSIIDGTSPMYICLSLEGDNTKATEASTTWFYHFHALEALTIQQMSGTFDGAGAHIILKVANAAGTRIYKGTSSNWSTDVLPNLSNYPASLNANVVPYLNAGWSVLLPQSGDQVIGGITFDGWALQNSIANGGVAGGFIVPHKGGAGPKDIKLLPTCRCCECEEADPVGLRTGAYKYRQTDLTIGSSSYPYQLSFGVEYDSLERHTDGPLGLGWRHTWQHTAQDSSSGFRGLGSESPIDAVASIVSLYATRQLIADNAQPIINILTAWFTTSWWCENMTNNVGLVETPEERLRFARLPDGSYMEPHDSASTLVKTGGNFQLTTPQGTVYNYGSDGNLATIVFPFGVTITLTYSGGLLQTVSNGMGRTLTLSYSGTRLASVTDGTSRSVQYTVDGTKNLTAIKDPLGNDVTFEYDQPGRIWKYFLPENPSIPMVTNTYDSFDRIASQLDVNGNPQSFYFAGWRSEFVNTLGYSQVYHHDALGNLIKYVDELGFITKHVFDGLSREIEMVYPEGNKMQWTYDSKRNVLTETRVSKPGSPLSNTVKTFTYHPTWNKVATAEDALGNVTSYSYVATTGNLLSIARPVVDGQTPQVVLAYNSRGQILTRQDETGIVAKFEYDSATEKLNQVTQDFGTGRLNLVTVLGYNSRGDVTSVQDPRGNIWSFTFDDKRRATQKTDPAPFSYLTKLTYDKNDNLKKLERQTGIPATPWQVFEATLNANNQLLTLKDPLNNTVARQYDDLRRLWKQTDEMNRTTEFQYDARSNLWKVINPASIVEQTITYSANGLKTSLTDAGTNTTQMTFDGLDRENKTIYPDSTFEQNSLYDANDNVLTRLIRSGDSIVMTYDVLNRRKTKAPQGQPTVTFFYDLASRMTKASTPVVSGNPASGDFEFFFDTAGRFLKERNPDGKEVTFQLDQNGNATRLIYPDGYFADRVYDELNRLTDIKLNGTTTSAAHFDYNALSRRTKLTYGNGTSVDYSYGLDDSLSQILHTFSGSTLSFGYGYNLAREVVSQTSSKKNHIWTPSVGSNTAYGAVNNLNEYPTVGAASLSYNTNGCLTNDGTWQFGYDAENHLISATDGTVSASYVYDPMHRQIQKNVGTTKTRFVYSGWQRIADYDGSAGTLQNRYVYGAGLDESLIRVSNAGVLTYMHSDRLGSIIAFSDNTGAISNRCSYSPYGEHGSMSSTDFGYTGQRFDSETGLYYFKNRYYSAKLGRFLQPDSALASGNSFNLNLYAYVDNNPLYSTDPNGRAAAVLAPLAVLILLAFLLYALLEDQRRKATKCPPIKLPEFDLPQIPTISIPTVLPMQSHRGDWLKPRRPSRPKPERSKGCKNTKEPEKYSGDPHPENFDIETEYNIEDRIEQEMLDRLNDLLDGGTGPETGPTGGSGDSGPPTGNA